MLVVEKADGSKETTILSRKQALATAVAANLDLVQGEIAFASYNAYVQRIQHTYMYNTRVIPRDQMFLRFLLMRFIS